MKKKIDWINHGVSFVVVLTGILLAFQLSQFAENRKRGKTIENHRNGLLRETKANKANLKRTLEITELSLKKVDTLNVLLEQGTDLQNIDRLSQDLLTVSGAYFIKNAYNVLVESGDIRFMRNFDGKAETIILYEYYKIVALGDDVGMEYSYQPYFKYIMNSFDLFNRQIQNREVYLSKGFTNLVGSYEYFLQQRITSYKICQEKIDDYLEFAENEKQ
jgi:hypothetical protein